MKKIYNSNGFSLIELLVVIALMGIIGTITSRIFVLTIRSHATSEIIKEVKQSGDYASSVMEFMIRNAINADGATCNMNDTSITIINQDGFKSSFDCSEGEKIASKSANEQGTFPIVDVPITNASVRVTACTFRLVCPTPPATPRYVFINFSLTSSKSDGLSAAAVENYQMTIPLRSSE